jgi:molybdopterin-guanine dinucleotide biosynthesis protein MobB
VSFVGNSGAGKTTLLEKVVRELKARGYRVAVIKHAHHDFEIDHEGKDSWRFAQAGSDCVVISSPARVAMVQRSATGEEPPLEELVALVAGRVDIVLTEGFRSSGKPQVLVKRSGLSPDPELERGEHLAVVSDVPAARPELVERRAPLMVRQAHHERLGPHFDFAAVPQLTDFLLAHFGLLPRVAGR